MLSLFRKWDCYRSPVFEAVPRASMARRTKGETDSVYDASPAKSATASWKYGIST
jgi:hypothetical protein